MQSWRLDIEYEGTRYGGWQKQPHARTVQGEIIKAAESFLNVTADVGGAGRTDAGVHALHQVAHLRANLKSRPPSIKQLHAGINSALPHDITLLKVQPAPPGFHARHDAIARSYLYQISTRRTAFGKPYVWWVRDKLNVDEMAAAAELIVGKHDFASFCESRDPSASTLVQVDSAQIVTAGSLILFRIVASHFLWKMVRRVVGSLAEVGRGKISVVRFSELLQSFSNEPAALTAPPSGLFLERVLYKGDKLPASVLPVFPIR
jgi:tRNA pseudouridine38-40 synthase